MENSNRYIVTDSVWRATPEFLAVARVGGHTFSFGGSAPQIWRALAAQLSVGQVIESLAGEFAIPPTALADDVRWFVQFAERELLLSRVDAGQRETDPRDPVVRPGPAGSTTA